MQVEGRTGDVGREAWMAILAQAPADALRTALADALAALGGRPATRILRAPEIGTVMVRGRAGGTGAPFNLGEMTVTRATLALDDGTTGHAWITGRDKTHAEDAALADALMQRAESAAVVRERVIAPLATAARAGREARAAKADATKVDFFTMVRGED